MSALTRDRGTAKAAAIRAVDSVSSDGDAAILRTLLLDALTEFSPRRGDDMKSSDARGWILAALGRVADGDDESNKEVRRHLDANVEPDRWARYWGLEGLIRGEASDIDAVARRIVATDTDLLVQSLAYAVLASRGDGECQRLIEDRLVHREGEDEEYGPAWAMLRALRIVPLVHGTVVRSICDIVEHGSYSNLTFDAIVALGQIPHDSRYAEDAAQALASYLVKFRWPMHESMRVRALEGLGNLKVARFAPILIEELADDSQGIVSAAARALEAVVGVQTATTRLLEAAVNADPDTQARFAAALRYMDRAAAVRELETAMLTGQEPQQAAARNLLSEVGGAEAFQRLRARTDAVDRYLAVLDEAERRIRELFEDSIVDARRGFKIATRMDVVVFAIGVVLVAGSALAILVTGGTLDSWAGVGLTGGAGVLGVLYGLLIANPRREMRRAVDHLMHLKVVFLAYLRQLHQTDQAYTRRLLEDRELGADDVSAFTKMVGESMALALSELSAASTTQVPSKTRSG